MLVIVSDLHFCDGSAYPNKVEAGAFRMLLAEVGDLAASCKADAVDLVLLGDVVDLLRTTAWLEVPLDERPWGLVDALDRGPQSPAVLAHAHGVLANVATVNEEALTALTAETVEGVGPDGVEQSIPLRRFYMPGNHDRLCLHDDALFSHTLSVLGALPVGTDLHRDSTLHTLVHPDYGLLARHGHEWDPWNFERYETRKTPSQYHPADYLPTPLGDPITTELVASLPYRIRRELTATGLFEPASDPHGPAILAAIVSRLQRIEDVRPTIAAFRWAAYEVARWHRKLSDANASTQANALSAALNKSVHEAAAEFLELPFYKEWRSRHGWLGNWANRFHALLELLTVADLSRVSDFVERVEKIGAWLEGVLDHHDPYAEGARLDDLAAAGARGMRYVVYGHTHEPRQVALRATTTQDLYLNSGTWRGRQFETAEGGTFVGWEQCTWLAFYKASEPPTHGRTGPAFESWTGQRKLVDHGH